MEHIAACHQYVYTGLNQSWGRLVLYAAVHLYQCLRTALVYEPSTSISAFEPLSSMSLRSRCAF